MASALNLAVLVLAQITAVSRAQLCWEFANVAAAIAIAAVAFVAIALFFFRRRTGDPTLIYFGLFCILYAVRLLSESRARSMGTIMTRVDSRTAAMTGGRMSYALGHYAGYHVPPPRRG